MAKLAVVRQAVQRLGSLENQRAKLEDNIAQEENQVQREIGAIVVNTKEVDLNDHKKALRTLLEIWAVTDSDDAYERKVRSLVGNWVSYYQSEVEEYDE